MKSLTFFLFFVSLQSLAAEREKKCDTRSTSPMTATVLQLSDGDTISVLFSDKTRGKVRFLGVDTPETHFGGRSQGAAGERAHEHLAKLLPEGTEVELQFDSAPCDMYGRYLAYVHKGGEDINRRMVSDGFAANFCFAPALSRCDDYLKAAQEAAKRSLFVAEKVEYPHEFRIRTGRKLEAPYMGSLETRQVRKVRSLEEMRPVPPEQRVFFLKKGDIRSPYKLVD